MNERRKNRDRRCEPREVLAGQITWGQPGGTRTFSGWLSDRSSSSISFIASARREPALGEELDLFAANALPVRCRVARTAVYDENLSLVACTSAD